MRLLALDIGSSSVKAAVLRGGRAVATARIPFKTSRADVAGLPRAEVEPAAIERAIREAIAALGKAVETVDLVASATMAPSWLALDARGRPLTPVVTHQDRRAVDVAAEIERRVGKARHLKLAGNRPFPGGISSTTCAWFLANERSAMRRAALVGHLGTWLAFALTGERVIDLSNAGFTGLMDVQTCAWSDALIDAVGVDRATLPTIVASDAIVGRLTASAARRFGLTAGTPLLAGCVDGSAAMLAAGARVGQLVNVCGSTDVLALCTRDPHPHDDLLTRPLGIDGKWLSVATIAAAGSAIEWLADTFYRDLSRPAFYRRLQRVAASSSPPRAGGAGGGGERQTTAPTLAVDGTLAGSRTAMTVARGAISGLTLASTRDDVLGALVARLAVQSAARLARFEELGLSMRRDVFATGGGRSLAALLRRDWPRRYTFDYHSEATGRGLAVLAG